MFCRSSFNRLQYGWQTDYDAGREWRIQNLALNPEISLPFAGIPWLTVNLAASGNLNYYRQSYQLAAGSVHQPDKGKNNLKMIITFRMMFLFHRVRLRRALNPKSMSRGCLSRRCRITRAASSRGIRFRTSLAGLFK